MSMAVKPGYINPLTMMGHKKTGLTPAVHTQQESKQKDDVKDLETKQQGLQNQILLMKSTTSTGTEEMEQKLEEITTELKAAKSQTVQTADSLSMSKRFDSYETAREEADSFGLYEIQQDEGEYKVSFSPYPDQP